MAKKKSPIDRLTAEQIEAAQFTLESEAGQHIETIYVCADGNYHIQKPKELFTVKDTGKKDPRTGKPVFTKIKKDGEFINGSKVISEHSREEILAIELDKSPEEEA